MVAVSGFSVAEGGVVGGSTSAFSVVVGGTDEEKLITKVVVAVSSRDVQA